MATVGSARFYNRLLAVLFASVLVGPSLAQVFRLRPLQGLDEKRALAKLPAPSTVRWTDARTVAGFARDYEAYFGDHFGLRKLLIGGYRLLSFHLLRTTVNPAVVVGQAAGGERWLYYHGSAAKDGIGLEGQLGGAPLLPAELAGIAVNLQQQAKLLADHGVELLVVAVPDKQTIYPEYLPARFQPKPGARSRLDQVSEVAYHVLGARYLDLRASLLQGKSETLMYFPQDTHWTPAAAFIAYGKVMESLHRYDPTRSPLPRQAFVWRPSDLLMGDLSDLAGLPPIWKQPLERPALVAPLPASHRRGKLLMYCDSYFRDFVAPYLEADFAEVKIVYSGYRAGAATVNQAALAREKPNLVLIASAERFWTK